MNYYPNYNSPAYMQNVQDLQNMRDRIDKQLNQMQQTQMIPSTPSINQTFQITPNSSSNSDIEGRFVKTIDEVKNILVLKTGIFLNEDYTSLWVKDTTGKIRSFSLSEIIELDDKDKQILILQKQIEEMKGKMNNGKPDNTTINESIKNTESSGISNAKSNDEQW